jgi:hypothetical protein
MVVSGRDRGGVFYGIAFEIVLNVTLPAIHQLTYVRTFWPVTGRRKEPVAFRGKADACG